MPPRVARISYTLLIALAAGACAVRLGAAGPRELDVLAFEAAPAETPDAAAARIAAANAGFVMLSADRDSAWFADVAARARLNLSGPGFTGGTGLAMLTQLEAVGDTTLVLEVEGGGSIHMHDALYRLDAGRPLNLMIIRVDAPALRPAVTRLLDYIASDTYAHAPVVLAVAGATHQAADSVALLMRAYYNNEIDCPGSGIAAGTALPVRLLYGPSARITCRSSRVVQGETPAAAVRAVTGR